MCWRQHAFVAAGHSKGEALSKWQEQHTSPLVFLLYQLRATRSDSITHAKSKKGSPLQEAGAPQRIERARRGKMGGD